MERQEIQALAAGVKEQVLGWRRHLHQHPELSWQEAETAAFVAQQLREMGYEPRTNVGTGYGIIATLDGGMPGPTIALRADMDALPIQEETGLPFASQRPGIMHACGHDAHTAILLGAAAALSKVKDQVPGRVVFLFQPAEEKAPGGAKGMVEAGVLDGVDAVFGVHVTNPIPAGRIGIRPGPVNAASDQFQVTLRGKGGHAAWPHNTVDPIPMLGTAISAVQSIVSRMVNPIDAAVLTIGWVRAGEAANIIPEKAEFGGTIRTFDPKLRELIPARLEAAVKGAAAIFGGEAELAMTWGYPVNTNDPAVTEVARQAAALVLGEENVVIPPAGMGGEDFAYYSQERPTCFVRLGTGTPETESIPAHNPRFVISEDALSVGVAYYLSLALNSARLMAQ